MTSKFVSRLINDSASPSVYETIRQGDVDGGIASFGNDPCLDLDEENLGGHYHDEELAEALADAESVSCSRFQDGSLGHHPVNSVKGKEPERSHLCNVKSATGGNYDNAGTDSEDDNDDDDDVPPSLLVEGGKTFSMHELPPRPSEIHEHVIQINEQGRRPGSSHRTANPRWKDGSPSLSVPPVLGGGLATANPRDKAMWRWTNVENLDNFLMEVYTYFRDNGIQSICLRRFLNLLTLAFVVGFSTFLVNCIDYRAIPHSKLMPEIVVPKCAAMMSGWSNFLVWLFALLWIGKAFQYSLDIVRLSRMHDFYYYLLGISDTDIQTISWQEVVSRLMALRDLNPATAQVVSPKHRKFIGSQSKQRMDAQDIANRLMRKDNYLIALFNKDILDLTLPIPFMKHRQLFSRTLEWNLNICILDFVFNEQGQVRPIFLKDTHRKPLSQALRRRFLVIGILNVFIAPFLVAYFLMHHFFRYFNEYQKNPSLVGSRQYTPLAEWKFREFNELSHLFQRRINMSYPFASRYIDQFPKDKTIQLARFVGFIAGAIASVLALASVIDPELFLGFEITPDRTVLFYLGIFGSIWAGARGMVPEKTLVFDPEFALREVIDYTHYQPSHWRGKLHSDEVRRDFAIMYQMKVVIFMEEILSMIIAPFVLCFSLPHCSDQIIDFFREFTIHVDGLGYICSFAEFNFQKGVNAIAQERPSRCGTGDPRGNYFSTKDNKLLASYFGFLDNYGDNNLAPAHRHRASRWSPISVNSPGLAPTVLRNDLGDRTYSPARRAGSKRVAAPMRSFLLDPHHQPCSASGFRPAPLLRPAVPNQRKSSQRSLLRQHHRFPASASVMGTPPVARKDFAQSPHTSALDVNHGGGGSGDDDGVDDMDASWKSHLDENAENDENDHDNGDDVQNLVEGPGVLGLMKQLQKATN